MRTRILDPNSSRPVSRIGRPVATCLGLVAAAFGLPSCDDTNAGRLELDPNPPVVTRILVQEANTYQITDLLNTAAPLKCSDTNPCPVGTSGLGPTVCTIPDGKTEGECDNPTSASNEVLVSGDGALQVRIILSKILDPAIEKVMTDDKGNKSFALVDPMGIQLLDPSGKDVSGDKYYDNTGSNVDSADPIGEPLGPALVINIPDQLIPAAKYTIKINGASFKDSKGQAITNDANGPIKSEGYTFTTEGLYIADAAPKLTAVAPNDVVTFTTNAFVADDSISVVVKDGAGMTVANALAWPELDPKTCTGAAGNLINVFLTDGMGNPTGWTPGGTYTITVSAKDAATGKVELAKEDNKITVTMTPGDPMKDDQAVDNHVLPVPCKNALNPKDGGATD